MRARVGLTPAHEAIQILDADGCAVDLLARGGEWDSAYRVLTVRTLRTGRGDRPRLLPGEAYRLVVTTGVRSVEGLPLARRYEHRFHVGPERLAPIDPRLWKVAPPTPGSRLPLAIGFPYPLDGDSIRRSVHVLDASGLPVAGQLCVNHGATSIAFHPDVTWYAGAIFVRIDARLEDEGGNRLIAPFGTSGAVFEAPSMPDAEPFEVGASLFSARPTPLPLTDVGAIA